MLAHRATIAVLCLAIGGTVGGARAQSTGAGSAVDPDAVSHARALFLEGAAQARSGNWTEALDRFVRSHALRPHAVTEYNIGYCERALGHYTRARKALLQAIRDHETRGGVEMPADMIEVTRRYLDELDLQIARVTVTLVPGMAAIAVDARPLEQVPGAQSVMLAGTRDAGPGEVLPASPFELQIDPGTHVFVVSLAGHRDSIVTRELVAGATSELTLALADEIAATPSAAMPIAPTVTATRQEPRAVAPDAKPVVAYVALIAGAAGLVAGGVAGTVAWVQESKLADKCPHKSCIDDDAKALDRANATADIATATLIAGGAVFAGGAVLWMFSGEPEQNQAQPAHVSVRPWLGLAAAGCAGRF